MSASRSTSCPTRAASASRSWPTPRSYRTRTCSPTCWPPSSGGCSAAEPVQSRGRVVRRLSGTTRLYELDFVPKSWSARGDAVAATGQEAIRGAGDEVQVVTRGERPPLSGSGCDVEDVDGCLPGGVEALVDPELRAVDVAEELVPRAGEELALREAHGHAARAAPTGLDEHDLPALAGTHGREGRACRRGGIHPLISHRLRRSRGPGRSS